MLELKTKKREKKAPAEEGYIPAVFYGKTTESTPVFIKNTDFKKVFEKAGESTVVTIKDDSGEHDALIHDVQFDVLSDEPVHVDFYVFEKGKKIEVEVPLEFIGKSRAMVDLDGILVKVMHDLPIKAQPKDLPHDIKVDISALIELDSVIHAKDLQLPDEVDLAVDPEEVICSITEAKEEEEEPVEIDLDSIEVEKKGKQEEDGETTEDAEKTKTSEAGSSD